VRFSACVLPAVSLEPASMTLRLVHDHTIPFITKYTLQCTPPPPPGLLHFCSSHRDLCNTKADYGTRQCCGSGSGIRCLFDLGIRNRFFPDPGSQVLIFLELSDSFLSKKFCDSLKIFPNFFPPHFKTKVNCNFVKFVAPPLHPAIVPIISEDARHSIGLL
jgi:hypothetical protein